MVMEVGQLLSSKAFPRLWVTGGPWRTTEWWLVMVRPMQTVKAYGVQDRRSTTQAKLPWVVRYTIDGRHRSKSFRTRIEALMTQSHAETGIKPCPTGHASISAATARAGLWCQFIELGSDSACGTRRPFLA